MLLFHKASEEDETRILTTVGMTVAICAAAAVAVFVFAKPFSGRPSDQFGVVFESPYVGQGVVAGTVIQMHGVKVGEVTQITNLPGGAVRLTADLQRAPTAGLTDTVGIDFRPANYFGVTGINLRPGQGGQALAQGSLVKTTPSGNFTLPALLSRLGELSHGVVTPHLIDVIEKVTDYADSLDPLLETMLVMSNSLAKVQTVSTARLLTNTAGISVALPGLTHATMSTGNLFVHAGELGTVSEEYYAHTYRASIEDIATGLFGALGKLLGSHPTDLYPATNLLKVLTDTAPGLVPSDAIADTLRELRTRLEKLFAGPPDRRAVNVRVILDSLPGVAAPIGAMGGP